MIGQLLICPHGQRNPLDQALQNALLSKAYRTKHRLQFERWTAAIDAGIFAFSDIQLITSLAVLISGYLQLPCGLSVYHWQIIVNLSWFSALTHLTTLTSLRQHFRSRPFMAICRALFMGTLLILLSVAFVPTGYLAQRDPEPLYDLGIPGQTHGYTHIMSSPAWCLFKPETREELFDQLCVLTPTLWTYLFSSQGLRYNTPIVVLSLSYLITSYLTRLIRISTPLSHTFEFWLESVPITYLHKRYRMAKQAPLFQSHPNLRRSIRAILLIIITFIEALYETGDSMIWEILWLGAALVWGALRMIGLRIQTRISDENKWGFGQTLPLVLSIIPIWCLLSTSYCSRHDSYAERGSCRTTQHITRTSSFRRIRRSTWFRVLTILIMGTAAVMAAYLLFDIPGAVAFSPLGLSPGIDSGLFNDMVPGLVIKYLVVLIFCAILLVIFICICLYVDWRAHRPFNSPPIGERHPRASHLWVQRAIRYGLWPLATLTLLTLEVTFIVTTTMRPGWLMPALFPPGIWSR